MSQINESAIATPGVYVTEIPAFPPSVAQVSTAVPAFIGYTPQAVQNGKPVFNTAVRLSSLVEFTTYFGTGFTDLQANVILNTDYSVSSVYFNNASIDGIDHGYQLFNAIQLFFNNGGTNCYIIALPASGAPALGDFIPTSGAKSCFDILQKEDEPTLIVIPDAVLLDINGFNSLMNAALNLCGLLQDRFTIMDIYNGDTDRDYSDTDDVITVFRNGVSGASLNYGAAYYPWLRTSLAYTPAYPNTFAYGNIVLQQPAGTIVKGSDILSSSFALQIENADSDMTTIITPFINTPNLAGPIAFTLTPASLVTSVSTSSIATGFGLIPQVPQIDPMTELENKLAYINNLIIGFIGLTGFIDTQPSNISTQGIFNNYTLPGTPAVAPSTVPNYSPIELLIKELFLLNESFPPGTTPLLTILTAPILATYTNITLANIPVDITIYGTPPAGSTVAQAEAFEVSFTRQRVLTLYTNVVNYITSFFNDVASRISGLDMQLSAASPIYANIKTAIANEGIVVPPSGAIAGVYASVDGSRGVWKSPANVSLNTVIEPVVDIDDNMQGNLNIDPIAGKSVNAIRAFTGMGTYVWGARTLTGNDDNFRYISVRRFYIMVEESVKLAAFQFVFEPNDAKTWTRIRAMIENYLTNLWRQGALAGPKPEASFWVKVGLGQTMTFQDVLDGKMIVEIGMAPVRPAEFIILRFTQIQQTA
jgi:phage tail sheath protein FI